MGITPTSNAQTQNTLLSITICYISTISIAHWVTNWFVLIDPQTGNIGMYNCTSFNFPLFFICYIVCYLEVPRYQILHNRLHCIDFRCLPINVYINKHVTLIMDSINFSLFMFTDFSSSPRYKKGLKLSKMIQKWTGIPLTRITTLEYHPPVHVQSIN